MQHKKITFIGAGNMTRSIIAGLIEAGYPTTHLMACNRTAEKLNFFKDTYAIATSTDNDQGVAFADVVVLAVKPQMMEMMCKGLENFAQHKNTLFLSIAAGINVQRLQEMLGNPVPIVRAMPNTPSLIGQGLTGLYADRAVAENDKRFIENMMDAVGKSVWVEKESDINTVIAAAGSSPAYFFLFLEAMQKQVIDMGLDAETARLMVQQAMLGAAEMVCHNSEVELSTLRAQVTSKGGTTAQAIDTFMKGDLDSLVGRAMQAAVKRAQDMEATF